MVPTTPTPTVSTNELIDSSFQGRLKIKDTNSIRISNHNYCGITTSHIHSLTQEMEMLEIDIQGISETNLNTNHYKTRKCLHDSIKKHDRAAQMVWSTSDTESINTFKPGGTGLIAKSPITDRILEKGRDNLGRYT